MQIFVYNAPKEKCQDDMRFDFYFKQSLNERFRLKVSQKYFLAHYVRGDT